ncbi:hypothetical protein [Paenibacillus glacialis]|nr:hypothetical protein [Paenibacillus glacialis]
MVSTRVNLDRYKNVAMDGKLELNPGSYSYYDSSRDMEVELN